MNKTIIVMMLAMLLVVPLVSAEQDSLGTYTQNIDAELLQICGTCTYNNITSIVLPNSTHIVLDTVMTRRGAEYTYTFSQTDLLGFYTVNGVGDLDGTANAWAYEFEVTSNGRIGQDISDNALFISMFLLSLILFLIAILKGSYPIGFLSGISFVLTGMYTMIYGFAGAADLYTRGASIIIIGWGLIILLSSALEGVEDL